MRKGPMRRRAKQANLEILGEILHKLLKKRNIPHTSTDRSLLNLWRRAVGPQIAAQTHPDTLKRGSLFVRVSAPTWLHQLQFMKEEILCRLNEISDKDQIRHLILTIGELPTAPSVTVGQSSPESPLYPLPARDRNVVREILATVRDAELREILERVMTKEISHRRQREERRGLGK